MIKKIVIDPKGNVLYWHSGDIHSNFGKIKEADILKGGKVQSHLKKTFLVFDATFADQTEKIKRGPAIIIKKDAGAIVITTGINKESKVVEIGTGSAGLTIHLANISDQVTSYEKNKQFCELAQKNLDNLGLKATIKNKDATKGIQEKEVDVITIDMQEPWLMVKHAEKALKSGGWCIAYVPHTSQIQQFCQEAAKHTFYIQKVSETQEREWIIEEKKSRPKNTGIVHTGFLVFLRKY